MAAAVEEEAVAVDAVAVAVQYHRRRERSSRIRWRITFGMRCIQGGSHRSFALLR
jgi:uncharacterized membrane protein